METTKFLTHYLVLIFLIKFYKLGFKVSLNYFQTLQIRILKDC